MNGGVFQIVVDAIAEDDGRAWEWSEPCPTCQRCGPTQVRDVSAALVSPPAPIVRTDAGSVLIVSSLVATAAADDLVIPRRPARLLDHDGDPVGDYVQLVATSVLTARSVVYEACGCVDTIDWKPLVVASVDLAAQTFTLDAHSNVVLVAERLARFLQRSDPSLELVPVQFAT